MPVSDRASSPRARQPATGEERHTEERHKNVFHTRGKDTQCYSVDVWWWSRSEGHSGGEVCV